MEVITPLKIMESQKSSSLYSVSTVDQVNTYHYHYNDDTTCKIYYYYFYKTQHISTALVNLTLINTAPHSFECGLSCVPYYVCKQSLCKKCDAVHIASSVIEFS